VTVLGDNSHGQLGYDGEADEAKFLKTPKTLSFNVFVKEIACGADHTHLISREGHLYSMGSNEHGQLGLGFSADVLPSVKLPTLVSDLNVKSVACGRYHSLALNDKGSAYGWGQADHGAIGVRISSSDEPSVIQFSGKYADAQVKDISCGSYHSCFLSTKGEVFSCGQGDKGQLGIGFISPKEYRPIVIRLRNHDEKIKQVSCGAFHTCLLTLSGKIFSSGLNDEGQLGLGLAHEKNISWPELIESTKNIKFKQISCGKYSCALDEQGQFYAWGNFNG